MKPYKPSELAVQMMDYLAEEDGIDWQQEIMGVRGQELLPRWSIKFSPPTAWNRQNRS